MHTVRRWWRQGRIAHWPWTRGEVGGGWETMWLPLESPPAAVWPRPSVFFFSFFFPIPQAVKHTSKGNVLRPWHRVDSASAKVSLWTRSLAGVDTFPWRSLQICLISEVQRSRDEALPNELQDRCDWTRRPGSASPPALISRQSGKTALRKIQFWL